MGGFAVGSRWTVGKVVGVGLLAGLAVLAQLVGLFALGELVWRTEVQLNHGQRASCDYVDMPSFVPLAGIETREFDQSWSWWPPGLVCRTDVGGRTVTVREPTWRAMGGPLLVLVACVAVAAVTLSLVLRITGPERWRQRRALTGLATVVAQPVTVATAAVALLLPPLI